MIKYYLIPAEHVVEDGSPLIRPKHMEGVMINWSGIYIKSKDAFLIVTNESKDLKKFDSFENKEGVEKIKESEVETLGKLQEPSFKKDKFWVSD